MGVQLPEGAAAVSAYPEEYLGDGVYASFDGYHVWLDTRAQHPVNRIALEPAVLDALERYVASLNQPQAQS